MHEEPESCQRRDSCEAGGMTAATGVEARARGRQGSGRNGADFRSFQNASRPAAFSARWSTPCCPTPAYISRAELLSAHPTQYPLAIVVRT